MAQRELQILLKAKDEASGTIKGLTDRFLNFKTIGIGAITSVGGTMTKAGIDIDKAQSNIVKGTGASGDELENFVKISRDVNNKVPQNLDSVSSVLAEVNTRLGVTGDDLSKTTKQMLDFSRVTGTDGVTAVKNVTRMMADWGIDNSEELLNQLTKASQISGASVEGITQKAVDYGVQLRSLGFDQTETISLLSKFEKEGVATEKIFGGLSMALGRLAQSGVDDTGEAFKMLTGEIEATGSTGDAVRQAIEILGTRAGPDFALAVKEGRFAIEDYVKELENTDGSLENTAKNSLTMGEHLSILRGRITDLFAPSGELNNIFGGIIERVTGWIEKNEEVIQSIVGGVGDAINFLIETIKSLWETFEPIISSAFFTIWDVLKQIIDRTKGSFQALWENLKELFKSFQELTKVLEPVIIPLLKILGAIIGVTIIVAIKVLIGIINFLINVIKIGVNILTFIFETIVSYFQMVKETISIIITAWQEAFVLFGEFFAKLWTQISETFKSIWNGVVEFFDKSIAWFENIGNKIRDFFVGVFDSIRETIKNGFKSAVNWVIDKINSLIDAANRIVVNGIVNRLPGVNIDTIPNIPRLAKGGIVNSPTLAMIGEAGPEAVVPLSKANNPLGQSGITINVYGDVSGQELMEKVSEGIMSKLRMNTQGALSF
jgi:phage-related minor tail protein